MIYSQPALGMLSAINGSAMGMEALMSVKISNRADQEVILCNNLILTLNYISNSSILI